MSPQRKGNKGISGIGTLIIFIALILVAAVAAIVLLQTSEALQSRAVATGRESEEQVSTKFQFDRITAHIIDNNYMDYLMIQGRLAPGSANIDLYETIFTYQTPNSYSSAITYLPTSDNNNSRLGALARSLASGGTSYSAYYLNYDINFNQSSKNSVIPGQNVELLYYVGNLAKNKKVEINFLPSVGAQTFVRFRTPVALDGNIIKIFP